MNILLLEDDILLNKSIKSALELNSCKVQSFYDGKEVLKVLEKKFDLYILDINVPNINGLELFGLIKNRFENIKVIIITSNVDIESIKKAYTLGCIDYLKKPFHLEELQFKIEKLQLANKSILSDISLKDDNTTLSKKERSFLILLLENKNLCVTYQMIDDVVYKDKIMTIDGLRSLVRRLRNKMQDDIIKNIPEEGYIIIEKS